MKTNAKILICYNAPVSIFSVYNGKPIEKEKPGSDLSESSFTAEIDKVKKSLHKYYTHVQTLAITRDVEKSINKILSHSPDVIFNFVESVEGIASYEYCMTGIYELLGVQYTGNLPSCLGNCLNKQRTKHILRSYGINTPLSITFKPGDRIYRNKFTLKFPIILKLLSEDASIGISEYSVVNNYDDFKKQLKFLFATYKQDVIVEEYIEGRELNVAILGNQVLPISEISFKGLPSNLPKIVTYESKWIADSVYYMHTNPRCPARINARLKKKIEETALLAFEALNCRDYARVDVRLSREGVPYVIEVNPNPDISTDSGFARAAAAAGLTHAELLSTIANFALKRKNHDTQIKAS